MSMERLLDPKLHIPLNQETLNKSISERVFMEKM